MKSAKLIVSALGSAALLTRIVLPRIALRALAAENTRPGPRPGPQHPVLIVRNR